MNSPLVRRATAEAVGTGFLVVAVIGSGIAAQRLSPNDVGLQLLESSLATGAALTVLILARQPVSAAFNPVITALERVLEDPAGQDLDTVRRVRDQIRGRIEHLLGVLLAAN
ncbi:MAG TPA: aquaporin [Microbacterium sp.]|nr:aquaporin [Microbacterium sp.]HEX5729493.1 aquaporin [Microbacterium sp.]